MSDNVIKVNFTDMLTGEAKCTGCGTEWEAKAPVGTAELECPECHTMLGVFVWPTAPRSEDVWTCNCGGQLFYIIETGSQCYKCGVIHTDFN